LDPLIGTFRCCWMPALSPSPSRATTISAAAAILLPVDISVIAQEKSL
jgi:hypothetical protein